jgi:hypothetical protein
MAYGVSVAWPPYGLDPAMQVSTDDATRVRHRTRRPGAAQPIVCKADQFGSACWPICEHLRLPVRALSIALLSPSYFGR